MPKRPPNQTLLFAGACALGATLFVGGFELRGRTDALSRVQRHGSSDEGMIADRRTGTPQIPLGEFYVAMTDLLKHEYVEPIKDDQKLASGGVRGMILSLGDPRCAFMDPDEFRAFVNGREGRYEGIGVEFDYRGTAAKPKPGPAEPAEDPRDAVLLTRVPYLVASMVVPGGPADRAGVKPGDVVADIDGHWVPDAVEIARFDRAVKDFRDKKIPFATVSKLQKSLRAKIERSLMPTKAKDRLSLGTTGTVNVIWKRAGVARTTKIVRGESSVSPFGIKNGAIVMRFDTESPGRLREAIAGKSSVTLDLRNNVDGDFDSMRRVLSVLAPDGTYGALATMKKESRMSLTVTGGNPRPPKLTLLVDETTRGPAAILARALATRHRATLTGTPGNDVSVRTVVRLPDGSGYTLVTGEYQPQNANAKVAFAEDRP